MNRRQIIVDIDSPQVKVDSFSHLSQLQIPFTQVGIGAGVVWQQAESVGEHRDASTWISILKQTVPRFQVLLSENTPQVVSADTMTGCDQGGRKRFLKDLCKWREMVLDQFNHRAVVFQVLEPKVLQQRTIVDIDTRPRCHPTQVAGTTEKPTKEDVFLLQGLPSPSPVGEVQILL